MNPGSGGKPATFCHRHALLSCLPASLAAGDRSLSACIPARTRCLCSMLGCCRWVQTDIQNAISCTVDQPLSPGHTLVSPFSVPAAGGGVGGMLKAVIDTVIGNLQLSISNVHIRWACARMPALIPLGFPGSCAGDADDVLRVGLSTPLCGAMVPRRRYEDDTTNPGHPFACGVTLDSIAGYTVDELGKEAFITNNPLQMLRKVGRGLGWGAWPGPWCGGL